MLAQFNCRTVALDYLNFLVRRTNLMKRTKVPELMDDPGLDPAEHERALRGLERINRFSNASSIMWAPIERLARDEGSTGRLNCLDIATGRGENPIRLWKFARQNNLDIRFDGCDFSGRAVELAMNNAAQANCPSQFFVCNPLVDEIPQDYDVTMSSLFFHHLDPPEVVLLLSKLRQCTRKAILVCDLVRTRANLCMVTLATRLLSDSPVVHFDGPASVGNAYTMEELRKMAQEAGLAGCSVTSRFPCRMLLKWKR